MAEKPFSTDPEQLWDQLLSRQAALVQAAYDSLAPEEQVAVVSHLQRMAEEPGWHSEQSLSARAALDVLSKNLPPHS